MSVESTPGSASEVTRPRLTSVAHAWISNDCYAALEREAVRRRQHPDALAAKIIDGVLRGGLLDVVVDC